MLFILTKLYKFKIHLIDIDLGFKVICNWLQTKASVIIN